MSKGRRSIFGGLYIGSLTQYPVWFGFITIILTILCDRSFVSLERGRSYLPIRGSSWREVNNVTISDTPVAFALQETETNSTLNASPDTPDNDPGGKSQNSEDEDDHEDEDWEIDTFQIPWGIHSNYQLRKKLGEGVYSEVFEAVDVRNNRTCVAKNLLPVSKRRVKREIKILQELSGGPNILKMIDVTKDDNNAPSIITEHIAHTYHRKLYPSLNATEIRFYMFQLLRAIEYAHSRNIMHRDIKPHNVMIDHAEMKLRLIDWGLADYYDENFSYPTSVASRFWRAPEILVKYRWYNPSVDIWAFGCILAGLVFQEEPFFRGQGNDTGQIIEVAKVLGTEGLFSWLAGSQIETDEEFNKLTIGLSYPRRRWADLAEDKLLASSDAIDLLDRILVYDSKHRLTATEALSHPYFDSIRQEALSHPSVVTTWQV